MRALFRLPACLALMVALPAPLLAEIEPVCALTGPGRVDVSAAPGAPPAYRLRAGTEVEVSSIPGTSAEGWLAIEPRYTLSAHEDLWIGWVEARMLDCPAPVTSLPAASAYPNMEGPDPSQQCRIAARPGKKLTVLHEEAHRYFADDPADLYYMAYKGAVSPVPTMVEAYAWLEADGKTWVRVDYSVAAPAGWVREDRVSCD